MKQKGQSADNPRGKTAKSNKSQATFRDASGGKARQANNTSKTDKKDIKPDKKGIFPSLKRKNKAKKWAL